MQRGEAAVASAERLVDALVRALRVASQVNRSVQSKPAAVVWTDAERQWLPAIPAIRERGLAVYVWGSYDPDALQGPAIWLKCAVAGLLPDVFDATPAIVYLPGVSRAELRAVESCPRELQPLAELQYRGVFWSQANGKDWTLNAFLTSRNGGLGLDVAQDSATQEALQQALAGKVLLDRRVDELASRPINAEWLLGLLAPDPARDLLAWLNAPDVVRAAWEGVRWDVFCKRCRTDFGFDPIADGVLTAAERLADGQGKWRTVADIYRDAYRRFPAVLELLQRVRPPVSDLFPDLTRLAGYPQADRERESALRATLNRCAELTAEAARAAVLAAEEEHAVRRTWLWHQMGLSPLAGALEPLAQLAVRTRTLPRGATPDEIADDYRATGWPVDAAALKALGAVQSSADLGAVTHALRALYLPWLEESARRLQAAMKSVGGLPRLGVAIDPATVPAGVCTVFVDGLRYDVAIRLQERLKGLAQSTLSAGWTSLPSVTASGKAWCSPIGALLTGTEADLEFEPRIRSDGKPLSKHHFLRLLRENGFQVLTGQETGDPQGVAWTEAGDLDHYGHEHGVRLARDIDEQLERIVERIADLQQAGWRRIKIVTDHGWLLVPGGLTRSQLAKHQTETRWGRCAVLKESAHGTPLTFAWDWCAAVQVAYAEGAGCFIAGMDYAHGGISLQECLVPVLELTFDHRAESAVSVLIRAVTWKRSRCMIEIETTATDLKADIRSKPALASTSLVAAVKAFQDGKVSLAVDDDDAIGSAAVVVILDADGEIVQKTPTTVGE